MITDGSCGADLERFGKEVEKGVEQRGKDWKREKSYFSFSLKVTDLLHVLSITCKTFMSLLTSSVFPSLNICH